MDLQIIQSKIYEIRGCRVMLDSDLAALYQVETKALKQAVKRNIDRFPDDFMFQLTKEEMESLRSQVMTLEKETGDETNLRSQTVTSNSIIVFLLVLLPKLLFIHNLILFQPWNILRRLSATRFPLFYRSKWYLKMFCKLFSIQTGLCSQSTYFLT